MIGAGDVRKLESRGRAGAAGQGAGQGADLDNGRSRYILANPLIHRGASWPVDCAWAARHTVHKIRQMDSRRPATPCTYTAKRIGPQSPLAKHVARPR